MRAEQGDVCFELVFVDDGSTDGTLGAMRALTAAGEGRAEVRWVSFSRNFGKEAAIVAGFEKAKGDIVVLMDADLQDPPALLPEMYQNIESGYDSVATRRVDRKGEPPIRSWFARRFYGLMRKISKTDIVDGARDYRMMTRQVVDAILSMREYNRFSKGIFGWVGFNTKWLEYSFLGIIFCVIAFAFLIFIFVRALAFGDDVAGWPSTICVITLLGGLQLLCLGIMGQYLSKLYLEVKDRPKYLVKEEFLMFKRACGHNCKPVFYI